MSVGSDIVWKPSDMWGTHRKPILELVPNLLFVPRRIIQDRHDIDPIVQHLREVLVGEPCR